MTNAEKLAATFKYILTIITLSKSDKTSEVSKHGTHSHDPTNIRVWTSSKHTNFIALAPNPAAASNLTFHNFTALPHEVQTAIWKFAATHTIEKGM